MLFQCGIQRAIRLGHRIVANLVFGLDRPRRKSTEYHSRSVQCGLYALQNLLIGTLHSECLSVQAHSIRAPVNSSNVQRMRRSHNTGTRVLRCEPKRPPGIEPIRSEATRVGSTFPSRKCNKPVTPVSTTACTISVPTFT